MILYESDKSQPASAPPLKELTSDALDTRRLPETFSLTRHRDRGCRDASNASGDGRSMKKAYTRAPCCPRPPLPTVWCVGESASTALPPYPVGLPHRAPHGARAREKTSVRLPSFSRSALESTGWPHFLAPFTQTHFPQGRRKLVQSKGSAKLEQFLYRGFLHCTG